MRRAPLLVLLASASLALGPALPAAASHDVVTDRLGGYSRYGTAAEAAHASHPGGASEVVVASGETFPDALAGAPVAAALGAPVLLVQKDLVPDVTLAALDELAPEHVTVLGGEDAVSASVERTIEEDGEAAVDRIAGADRYDTAALAARQVMARNGDATNWPGGRRAAFLATGEGFADALAAGAVAASGDAQVPILLTERDRLPSATAAAVEELDVDLVVVVGGPDAVSQQVQDSVEDGDTTTDRVAGETRTETAAAVADLAVQELGFDAADLVLTRGDAFADALAVAPLAGTNADPVLLAANPDELSEPTRAWLGRACGDVSQLLGIGLEEALTPQVLEDAEAAAETCHDREGFGDGLVDDALGR